MSRPLTVLVLLVVACGGGSGAGPPGGTCASDADGDSVCDAEDVCGVGSDLIDSDQDEVPDACDVCADADDGADADGDGIPDACDDCSGPDEDADLDGIADACDRCPGTSDRDDEDGDGVADGCDACDGADDAIDADGDGAPDACDRCVGFDDRIDVDLDGVADACDPCILSATHTVVDPVFSGAGGGWSPGTALSNGSGVIAFGAFNTGLHQLMCTPAAEVTPRAAIFDLFTNGGGSTAVVVTIDGQPSSQLIGATGTPGYRTVCLGEDWYGGSAELSFITVVGGAPETRVSTMSFDDAPTTCPVLGQTLNGAFDDDLAGWTGGTLVATDGDNQLRLIMPNACVPSHASGLVSVPAALPNPALRWRWSGTFGAGVHALDVDARRGVSIFASLRRSATPPADTDAVETLCLPATARGRIVEIHLQLDVDGVSCPNADTRIATFDDFELVSDPACP